MADDGLPQGLGGLFANGGAGRVLDVDLPPGGLVASPAGEPAYWVSDEPAGPDLWIRLHRAHPRSGLWPVLVAESLFAVEPRLAGGPVTPAEALDILWTDYVTDDVYEDDLDGDDPAELEPFGRRWPGLAPAAAAGADPDEFADEYVRANDDGRSRIMLAAAPRGADVLTAVGWPGALNHTGDVDLLAAVLHGWAERFGARLIEIGPDTLAVSVAAPPAGAGHAEQVAAEHFAFCPDNVIQGRAQTIRGYAAAEVQGKPLWSFWWD